MLGQMIVARFVGSRPTGAFLERIRSGGIGGVILFADNIAGGVAQTRALTIQLQHAARAGGNPPLLIMTDQEGGAVRRLRGPPGLPPSAMTSDRMAFAQGIATGNLLKAAGINVDLAPVADVEHARTSFLGSRAFGSDPSIVASRACSFAQGLQSRGIAYTLKHFPGLGRASGNTDAGPVVIDAPSSLLRQDYLPYVSCADSPVALVMVSSAIYPNLSGTLPAVMSPLIYNRELRIVNPQARDLTISDDLEAGALRGQSAPARQAIDAGLDLLLYAQTEQASDNAYQTLTHDARTDKVTSERIREAALAIETLKRHLAGA
jgi:beta-N-acetylhexosaminidase